MTSASENLSKALPHMAMATKAIHADDSAREPSQLIQMENKDPNAPVGSHVYGRYSAPNASRFETVLQHLFGGGSIMTYSTGLAAFHAAMVLLNPRKVCVGPGYHGVHSVIELVGKLSGVHKLGLEDQDLDQLRPGDVVHIETPVNPTGEVRDLAYYRARAHATGAYLVVDSTLAPRPLQDPLFFGADLVLHSGTKYIGGHSDLMCGIPVVHPDRVREG
ncbi:cystathionine beta-lyase [Aspergillus affinis]|uniref:cystathionine beta-lyase n=1 Tax=Aspergillus affinis TaxID=1070780 RepID=UPI0022FDDC2F|nr:cystathionine beta-lyase [Aspergillus affinis]KAI9045595.1 cystathionine beta-lyase [Aspergillus affinis]